MKINRLLFLLGLFGMSFFPKGDFDNVPKEELYFMELNLLDIERAKMINLLQGDNSTNSFIAFLEKEGDFEIKKRLVNEPLITELKEMVNKYSGKNLRSKKHNLDEIYGFFSSLNEKINSNKKEMTGVSFYKYYDQVYFNHKGEAIPGFNSNLEALLKDLNSVSELESRMDTASNLLERTTIKTFFNTLEDFSFLEEVVSENNFDLSSIYSIISKESFGYPYVVGYSGDLNYFQINPVVIKGLHNSLKKEDGNNYFKKLFGDLPFEDFKREIHENPQLNILAGTYLYSLLEKKAKNPNHLVAMYHLGEDKYSKLPSFLKEQIEKGSLEFKNYSGHNVSGYIIDYNNRKNQFDDLFSEI